MRAAEGAEIGDGGGFLAEDGSWTGRCYQPGGRGRQRTTFASPAV